MVTDVAMVGLGGGGAAGAAVEEIGTAATAAGCAAIMTRDGSVVVVGACVDAVAAETDCACAAGVAIVGTAAGGVHAEGCAR
mmetsp:Transcript_53190/g.159225  ORF Transcript_53190/g.159225 Transcript_53190/m.159225 type:complete len:82 (+) Transcript_53190:2171-2416(+)